MKISALSLDGLTSFRHRWGNWGDFRGNCFCVGNGSRVCILGVSYESRGYTLELG